MSMVKSVQSGERTVRALKIEEEIHVLQKNIGTSRYDFDKRWEKNAEMGQHQHLINCLQWMKKKNHQVYHQQTLHLNRQKQE